MNSIDRANTKAQKLGNPNTESDLSFIEVQFPVSKISKESYKERKAGHSQILTGLGKWWGRKPLILVRSTILALLMPASNNPLKDRDIFLKILMMDEAGLWKRKFKPLHLNSIIENLTTRELKQYFEVPVDLFSEVTDNQDKLIKDAIKKDISSLKLKKGLSTEEKEVMTRLAFNRVTYDDKMDYCYRPEEVQLTDEAVWAEVNSHLKTNANSLSELIKQLGVKKFGNIPIIGDCFAGGGSIPFEATQMGLPAYASDLNPLAGLLTWAGINVLSLSEKEVDGLKHFLENVFDNVAQQVDDWGIERNEKDWMAKYYLYCNETTCPHCQTVVPLAPSWIVSKKTNTIALLKINKANQNFDIDIISHATKQQFEQAEKLITVKDNSLFCPNCSSTTDIGLLRRDDKDEKGNVIYGLRAWESHEFIPRKDDVFRERLYCIKYFEKFPKKTWSQFLKKFAKATDSTFGSVYFVAPNESDLQREAKVLELLSERFKNWQQKGFIPSSKIISGYNTDQPMREKGWQFWHQLFNPRQLLINGLFYETVDKFRTNRNEFVIGSLAVNGLANRNSKLSIWDSGSEKGIQTFANQALNTLFNYSTRPIGAIYSAWFFDFSSCNFSPDATIEIKDARTISKNCHVWITDPPYADAVNYHELSEFFIAWSKPALKEIFPNDYADSRPVLAVKGSGESFNKSMVEIYKNLGQHMPDNGMQVVMFTHQSPAVWADLTLILWSAGLHVTTAWNIATETESGGLKEGNYVKGTVLLVLRKLTSDATAFSDTITYEIEEEVKHQIDSMRNLEDKEDPNFSDADYLLAAYAATLKILTSYQKIGDINVEYELSKSRDGKSIGPVEAIINSAIRTAYEYLIPPAFDNYIWKNLSAEERFFIKGMELEKGNVYQLGAYQEMARGFGIKDFKDILASTKANKVRFKTPVEFGNRWLRGTDAFGNTLLRHVLMAIAQSEKEENGQAGRVWLKNEVEDYWNKRQTIIELARYLSTTEHIDHMQHWESPALYAKYLVELISNDGV